jgi:hypothetical protein
LPFDRENEQDRTKRKAKNMKRERQIPSSRIERLIQVVYAGAKDVDPAKVTEALIDLSPRQHDIVWLHFGLGDNQPRNIGEVAKELGLRSFNGRPQLRCLSQ